MDPAFRRLSTTAACAAFVVRIQASIEKFAEKLRLGLACTKSGMVGREKAAPTIPAVYVPGPWKKVPWYPLPERSLAVLSAVHQATMSAGGVMHVGVRVGVVVGGLSVTVAVARGVRLGEAVGVRLGVGVAVAVLVLVDVRVGVGTILLPKLMLVTDGGTVTVYVPGAAGKVWVQPGSKVSKTAYVPGGSPVKQ